jgi:hypothetical protein
MSSREGFACPNASCKCKECTCGDGCTCGVSAEVTCDPCKDFKAMMMQKKSDEALREALGQEVAGKPVVLTPDTVVGYVEALNLPRLQGKTLVGTDSSTGNLNYCFVVAAEGATGGSVFVKQAPDFVRCLGEDAKLTTDRIRIEAAAALEFSSHAPGCLPQLLYFDAASCVLVMENLSEHMLLQDAMLAGDVTDAPAVAVARFMGAVHGGTLGSGGAGFANEALCGITTAYVFTLPFQADDSNSNDVSAFPPLSLSSPLRAPATPGSLTIVRTGRSRRWTSARQQSARTPSYREPSPPPGSASGPRRRASSMVICTRARS